MDKLDILTLEFRVPLVVVVTDEDSGDENEVNILHLPSMLQSQVVLQNRPFTSGANRVDDLEVQEEIDLPPPKKKKKKTIL
ncbi:hypothetical protein EVAR_54451_1 [Eumeta japonica]|uniref:Uncharacterized protein n=1 Tax=Eumeta variegata TaxID=151549 RepID=A0A4C1XKV4_EUMVA|nr:hypothetical protein EVAR_54451_1 [Eumeta japonica]